jgi:hypothetical protein
LSVEKLLVKPYIGKLRFKSQDSEDTDDSAAKSAGSSRRVLDSAVAARHTAALRKLPSDVEASLRIRVQALQVSSVRDGPGEDGADGDGDGVDGKGSGSDSDRVVAKRGPGHKVFDDIADLMLPVTSTHCCITAILCCTPASASAEQFFISCSMRTYAVGSAKARFLPVRFPTRVKTCALEASGRRTP